MSDYKMLHGYVVNHLAGWSGTWKEHDQKIGDKEMWKKGMWTDLSEWTTECENISVPSEYSLKGKLNRGIF